jgi:hypothetical protein
VEGHEESSEYEEYSESEEEDTGPRLKPVFVRKYDCMPHVLIIAMFSLHGRHLLKLDTISQTVLGH